MKLSKEGLELIKGFEGLRRRAARLADGRWTIGYGHTLSAREGAEVTPQDAELLLQYDLLPVTKAVNDAVSASINPRQFDALVSFALNIGVERFLASDVLRHLNAGNAETAAAALDAWRNAEVEGRGVPLDLLIRRRAAEKHLFLSDPDRPPMLPSALLPPMLDAAAAAATPLGVARASVDLEDPRARALVDDSAVSPPPERAPAFTPAQADAVAALLDEAPPEHLPAPDPQPEPAEHVSEAPTASPPPPRSGSVQAAMTMRLYSPYAGAAFGALPPLQPPRPAAAPAQTGETPPAPAPEAPPADEAAVHANTPPAQEPLVLTPPPEVLREPAPEPDPEPQLERSADPAEPAPLIAEFEVRPDEAVLFDEPMADLQQAQIVRHEEVERRFDWSETGAFIGMGVVGLIAFGSAMAAFRLAVIEDAAAFDQANLIAWTLAVIGSLCVGVSAYNLYKRWGGPRG